MNANLNTTNQQEHKPKNQQDIKKIHLIGIGGSGMSSLAYALVGLGYNVTGSDQSVDERLDKLKASGVTVFTEHTANNIEQAQIVVKSSAIPDTNPEIVAAQEKGITILLRAQMLAEILNQRQGIAVAGTHGKSTTTGMIAHVFIAAKLSPIVVNGAIIKNIAASAYFNAEKKQNSEQEFLIAEADESDSSFLYLKPKFAVVTNLEKDHMATYQGNLENMKEAYLDFIHNLPTDGTVILCIDCPGVRSILPKIKRKTITYGCSADADYQVEYKMKKQDDHQLTAKAIITLPNKEKVELDLNVPGKHNVLNATAALALTVATGKLDLKSIVENLETFKGIERRFDNIGVYQIQKNAHKIANNVQIIDDYGHHPTEIDGTIATCKENFKERRIVMIFEPHRYSRTKDLFDNFVDSLEKAHVVILLPTYAAGEKTLAGFESSDIYKELKEKYNKQDVYLENNNLEQLLRELVVDNDIIISQGAGKVSSIVKKDIISKFKASI